MNKEGAILEVRGLSVRLADRSILSNVDLSVAPGEVMVVLGPNGAGKSTLVRAIAGRLARSAGTIRVGARDPLQSATARGLIGFVPQQVTLYERLTPRENLAAFGALMGVSRRLRRQRTEELLALVGLSDRIDDPVRQLSGGMRRRVHIAVALMHAPALLILDEPAAGLDFQSRRLVAEILANLRQTGIAILLITHDTEEAEALADRIAVIVAGEIRIVGTPSELIAGISGAYQEVRIIGPAANDAPLAAELGAMLAATGLASDESGQAWSGIVDLEGEGLSELLHLITTGRVRVREMTIRNTRLETLVTHYVDTESPGAQCVSQFSK